MGVLGPDHLERVDGVSVARSGEGGFENWVWGTGSSVPEEDLTRVSSADDEVWVER